MLKYAREICFLSVALFFLTLTLGAWYSLTMVFSKDGAWLSKVAAAAMTRRAVGGRQGKSLGEKVADKLLANDGALVIKVASGVLKSTRGQETTKGKGAQNALLAKTIERLLAKDGELLATILAKMQMRRKNPMRHAIDQLLARDGRLLSRVLIRMNAARARKQPNMATALLSKPKVISKVLADVLVGIGVKDIVRVAKGKVRAIQTKVNLQREIRHALTRLPHMVAKMLELRGKKKRLDLKAWRQIKAQYPRIHGEFKTSQCIRLLRLRKKKNNRILAVARIKLLRGVCKKMSCRAAVSEVDQAILKWTSKYGIHEGHIKIRFGLIKRKCNTNR